MKTHADVALLLDVSTATLRYLTSHQEYREFSIPKKDGSPRVIRTPVGLLKTVQKRLAVYLEALYGSRAPVHGFCRGRSIKTNAQVHVGRSYVFNCDLQDFFESIHYGRVRGLFLKTPYLLPEGVAEVLTQLCCYKGSLPQGAATSPILTNLICAELDSALKRLARVNKCRYTRYADDLTFSSNANQFPPEIAAYNMGKWSPSTTLSAILTSSRFVLHPTKARMQMASERQTVTGLLVNRKVNIPRTYLQSVRGMLRSLERDGADLAEESWKTKYHRKQSKKPKKFVPVLVGKVNYIGSIKGWDSLVYTKLRLRLHALNVPVRSAPDLITRHACRLAVDQALWLIDAGLSREMAIQQSSGFSWGRNGIVTACHAVGDYDAETHSWIPFEYVQIRQPHLGDGAIYVTKVLAADPHADLALLEFPLPPSNAFILDHEVEVKVRDVVRVLGFPHYHAGDSVADQDFTVTQSRVYSAVHHRVIGGSIIIGNSGGPVLNVDQRVVGVALRGQQIPDHFSQKDSLSSFVVGSHILSLLKPDAKANSKVIVRL